LAFLDSHGQPLVPFNARRLADRIHSEMLGLIRGLLADGRLTDEEILLFRDWLRATPEAASAWPGRHLADRVMRVLADGIITEEEREDLTALMREVSGDVVQGAPGDQKEAFYTPTGAAFDVPAPPIVLGSRHFVLTGQFITGTRSHCEGLVTTRGGTCQSTPTRQTNYLVIGSIGSEQWAHSAYGRKIERAIALRDAGQPIGIVAEEHWVSALDG
jgi:hypothetical protein